jgi:Mg-chelatase subunit ChlD
MGGGTPLAAALTATLKLLQSWRNEQCETVVLLFTDGHANVGMTEQSQPLQIENEVQRLTIEFRQMQARVVVVDTQHAYESSDDTMRLAKLLNAQFVKPSAHNR